MSLLIQVVLLIAIALHSSYADVKHVLEGSAQPPQHIHSVECQHPPIPLIPGYPAGYPNTPSNAVPGSAEFWWADNNSPFKQAYEYFKKCSEKGNCLPPVAQGPPVSNPGCNPGCIALPSNVGQATKEPSTNEDAPIDISKNPFLNGNIPVLPTAGHKIDISKNPFLNGEIGVSSRPVNSITSGPSEKPDFSKNPFLNGGFGQSAFSGNGQAIGTGTNGFLGVQPSIPFGKVNGVKTKPANVCDGLDKTCVAPELCVNGFAVTDGAGLLDRRVSNDHCESEGKVCCRLPTETATSPHSTNTRSSTNPFPNISDIKNSKKASLGSIFQFDGGAGISPGSIQVISDNEAIPNLEVSNSGESGSSIVQAATSEAPVFASTPDYSNDNLNQLSFVSTTRGPQYLPPVSSPKPIFDVPELIAPSISTYEPFIPTTPKPFIKPVLPGASIVSIYPTPIPFVPSSPKPFIPIEPVPHYTPRPPLVDLPVVPSSPAPFYPQPPVSYVPFPSPPIIHEPLIPEVPVVIPFPQPPIVHEPVIPEAPVVLPSPIPPIIHEPLVPFEPVILPSPPPVPLRPEPEIIPIHQPSTPLVAFENRIKPNELPIIPYFPKVTPGYKYPTPTPPFSYPSPSTPRPSFSINDGFVPIKSKPTPKPFRPQPTEGYEYKKPTPSFSLPPKPQLLPQPSDEYEFKKPIPSFPTLPPIIKVTNVGYLPPIETYNPQPQPSEEFEFKKTSPNIPIPIPTIRIPPPTIRIPPPTIRIPPPTFHIPPPTFHIPPPTFHIPPPTFHIPPPTIKITNNEYLPPYETPQPNRIPDGSNTNEFVVLKPSVTTLNPNHEGQPDVQIPNIIRPPRPQQPSLPQAGCAAALKCVQEIYCTAEGVISPVPVILSKEQQLLRVPTTECNDREAGIIGRCCRDPNYIDPWPSANSINGFDDGQYREDPNLGKYFPQDQRSQRSEIRGISVKAPIRTRSNPAANFETVKNNTCGIRHFNSQPRSSGPIDVTFGEIPWQAMILRDSTRKLLCGGVIVKSNAVLTSAQCLDGLATSDILIKGGEWKLGIDEEPLPFQIVKVAAIVRHPLYKPGVLQNDLALLMLEEKLRVVKNVAPICLSENVQPQKEQCIATGWGKRILQVHLKGAIMRGIDINILDNKQCSEVIQERYKESLPNYFENTICGYSRNDQCDVDYGSALACSDGSGIYTLAGIFSWDTGCKDEAQIGGYIPPDVAWIEDTCSKPLTQLKALDKKYNSQY